MSSRSKKKKKIPNINLCKPLVLLCCVGELLHLLDGSSNIPLYHNSAAGICSFSCVTLAAFLLDHCSCFLSVNNFDRPRHGCVAPMMVNFFQSCVYAATAAVKQV